MKEKDPKDIMRMLGPERTPERVPLAEWEGYNKQERKRIAALQRCYNYLSKEKTDSFHAKMLVDALSAALAWLQSDDAPELNVQQMTSLRIRRDWLRKLNNKNGYQMQEFGAFNWLMAELFSQRKPGPPSTETPEV